MEIDLRALLLSTSGVIAVVGDRVAWGERLQAGALPSLVLSRASGGTEYSHDGDTGLDQTRVQADVWALTYGAANGAAKAVVAALSGYRGTVGNTYFHGIFLDAIRDLREAGDADAERLFRVSADFIIHHSEN